MTYGEFKSLVKSNKNHHVVEDMANALSGFIGSCSQLLNPSQRKTSKGRKISNGRSAGRFMQSSRRRSIVSLPPLDHPSPASSAIARWRQDGESPNRYNNAVETSAPIPRQTNGRQDGDQSPQRYANFENFETPPSMSRQQRWRPDQDSPNVMPPIRTPGSGRQASPFPFHGLPKQPPASQAPLQTLPKIASGKTIASPPLLDTEENADTFQMQKMAFDELQDSEVFVVDDEEDWLRNLTPDPDLFQDFRVFERGIAVLTDDQRRRGTYRPRYCWCFRCQLMYSLYRDDDPSLAHWGNYPCHKW